MICHFWDRSALETARKGNFLMGHRSGHSHGHGHGPSAADALTSGARYCRPRVLDRARDLLRDHDHITHGTVQVEPTDHKG